MLPFVFKLAGSWPASECLLRASFSVLGTAGPFLLLLSMLCLIRAVQLLLSHLLRVVTCCAVMPRRLPCWPRGGRAGHHQQRTGSFSDSVEHSLFHGFRVFATCITTTDHADTCVLPWHLGTKREGKTSNKNFHKTTPRNNTLNPTTAPLFTAPTTKDILGYEFTRAGLRARCRLVQKLQHEAEGCQIGKLRGKTNLS